MSRLFTCGWETGAAAETPGSNYSVVSSPARSGGYAAKFDVQSLSTIISTGLVVGRNYYARAWVRFPAWPSAPMPIIFTVNGTTQGISVSLSGNGKISLLRGPTVVAISVVLPVDTWHFIQLRFKHVAGVNDECEMMVNQEVFGPYVGTAVNDAAPQFNIGRFAAGTGTVYFDDVALNDDQGAVENSYPDANGAVVFLKPVADAQLTSWQDGAGGSVDLWDAVNNTPPVGSNSMSAKSQIYENAGNPANLYDARLESYASKLTGLVKLVQPIAFQGCGSSGGVNLGVSGVSNPASAQVAAVTSTSSAQAFPANWSLNRGTITYGDIADRDTPPVARFQKVTLSSVLAYCCQMGLLVEYVPIVPGPVYNDICIGIVRLSGGVVESYQVAIIRSDAPTGVLKLSGSVVESHSVIRIYNDAPTGSLALSGICTAFSAKGYSDSPTGTLTLSENVVDESSQRDVAPVGTLSLSGFTAASAKEYTDTCSGVLALIGVVAETLAYTDANTGKLTLSGTCTSSHLISADDVPTGTLHLSGRVIEYIVIDGNTYYDDFLIGPLPLSGRLIVPTEHVDYGIGGAGGLGVRLGRVVGSLTGRVT